MGRIVGLIEKPNVSRETVEPKVEKPAEEKKPAPKKSVKK